MLHLFKILSVFLVATVKYFMSPFYAYFTGLSMVESIIAITLGGITSFLFFYHISHFVIISTKYMKPFALKITPGPLLEKIRFRQQRRIEKKQGRRRFTRRNRMIVRMKKSGLWIIVLTTPFLLSLPVGAFLIRKYYYRNRLAVAFALLAIVLEGILFCIIVWNSAFVRPL
jgi:uncharacterized membrane protein